MSRVACLLSSQNHAGGYRPRSVCSQGRTTRGSKLKRKGHLPSSLRRVSREQLPCHASRTMTSSQLREVTEAFRGRKHSARRTLSDRFHPGWSPDSRSHSRGWCDDAQSGFRNDHLARPLLCQLCCPPASRIGQWHDLSAPSKTAQGGDSMSHQRAWKSHRDGPKSCHSREISRLRPLMHLLATNVMRHEPPSVPGEPIWSPCYLHAVHLCQHGGTPFAR